MSIQKECADHLREIYRDLPNGKLRSGHAHEFVAAYFGYSTAAALRSETEYPLGEIEQAAILIPDAGLMERRRLALTAVPVDLPSSAELASNISAFLRTQKYFTGEIWDSAYLSDDINGYIQNDPTIIEDALSGEIASTNAYFDELYIEEYDIQTDDVSFTATLRGSLNGEQDQDRAFHGDTIKFTSVMVMTRVAGRNCYAAPEFETGGAIDDSMYYDPDPT